MEQRHSWGDLIEMATDGTESRRRGRLPASYAEIRENERRGRAKLPLEMSPDKRMLLATGVVLQGAVTSKARVTVGKFRRASSAVPRVLYRIQFD